MTIRKSAHSTVTEASVQAALRRGPARQLAADEDKVMRMRVGASLPRKAEIEWVGTADEELAIELQAIEIETYLKLRAHQARRATIAASAARRPSSARPQSSKDKIVRALRNKGPTR